MNKRPRVLRRLAAGVLSALLLIGCTIPAKAETTMIGLEPNQDNLFSSMGNLVPGESRTDNITVKNVSDLDGFFYLHAESAGVADFNSVEEWQRSEELLSLLEMRIVLYDRPAGSTSGQVLYDGKAHQLDGDALMGNAVFLGELGPGKSLVLEVTVKVPGSLDNSYEGSQGKFWWRFSCYAEDPKIPPIEPPIEPPVEPPIDPGTSSRPGPDTSSNPDPGPGPGGEGGTSGGTGGGTGTSSSSRSGGGGTGGGTGGSTSVRSSTSRSGSSSSSSTSGRLTDLFDTEVPLDMWGNGWSLLNLILSLLALVATVVLVVRMIVQHKKATEEEEELDEAAEEDLAKRDGNWNRRHKIVQVLAIVLGILPIVLFLILEDFSRVVWLSRWSPLIISLVVLDGVALLVQFLDKRPKPEEAEEAEAPKAEKAKPAPKAEPKPKGKKNK